MLEYSEIVLTICTTTKAARTMRRRQHTTNEAAAMISRKPRTTLTPTRFTTGGTVSATHGYWQNNSELQNWPSALSICAANLFGFVLSAATEQATHSGAGGERGRGMRWRRNQV